ncbi:hypothetical protein M951_chr261 (nucleomorph) [Lotharella oceanica]|uniref:Uncharacterized protein n=1 Tax=Lotharella oceanica TaxID=641309 RepID=A0A060DGY1_9EUKA|nr:hypothetical protein M951_chr261 [Lotharella oceanica]|mmetsp:Transcript_4127/g.7910  ORF Transcript_4127/g.7910 Transcript_4127/m.7910 type:complete len:104 (+) Transcript_4127:47-358(+)
MIHKSYLKSTRKKRFRFICCEICNRMDHFTRNCKNGIFNWLNIFGKNTFKILNYQSMKQRKLFSYKQNLSIIYTIKKWKSIKYELNLNKNGKFYNCYLLNYVY